MLDLGGACRAAPRFWPRASRARAHFGAHLLARTFWRAPFPRAHFGARLSPAQNTRIHRKIRKAGARVCVRMRTAELPTPPCAPAPEADSRRRGGPGRPESTAAVIPRRSSRTGSRWPSPAPSRGRRFAAALIPRLFGNSVPGHTASPVPNLHPPPPHRPRHTRPPDLSSCFTGSCGSPRAPFQPPVGPRQHPDGDSDPRFDRSALRTVSTVSAL